MRSDLRQHQMRQLRSPHHPKPRPQPKRRPTNQHHTDRPSQQRHRLTRHPMILNPCQHHAICHIQQSDLHIVRSQHFSHKEPFPYAVAGPIPAHRAASWLSASTYRNARLISITLAASAASASISNVKISPTAGARSTNITATNPVNNVATSITCTVSAICTPLRRIAAVYVRVAADPLLHSTCPNTRTGPDRSTIATPILFTAAGAAGMACCATGPRSIVTLAMSTTFL